MVSKIRNKFNDLVLTIVRKLLTHSIKRQYGKHIRFETLLEPINTYKGMGIAVGSSNGKRKPLWKHPSDKEIQLLNNLKEAIENQIEFEETLVTAAMFGYTYGRGNLTWDDLKMDFIKEGIITETEMNKIISAIVEKLKLSNETEIFTDKT